MADYLPIPSTEAAALAGDYRKDQVLIVAWDRAHGLAHYTTFGCTAEDKLQVADLSDAVMRFFNPTGEGTQFHEDFRLDAARLKEENDRLKEAASRTEGEICQLLGRAIGMPKYADDPENFPGATEADGVCVGDHVAASLADAAAKRISELEALVASLNGRIHRLSDHLDPRADKCPIAVAFLANEQESMADLRRADFVRAGSDCICPVCLRRYYDHPTDIGDPSKVCPLLVCLCDGRRVKL